MRIKHDRAPLVHVFDEEQSGQAKRVLVVVELDVVTDGHPHVDQLVRLGQLGVAVVVLREDRLVQPERRRTVGKRPENYSKKSFTTGRILAVSSGGTILLRIRELF